jgi:hypothetical protein
MRGLFPDCAAGVFLVYDGMHPLAGLLEKLFAKLRAGYLFCQPHTIPSVVLKAFAVPDDMGLFPSKFRWSDSLMRFLFSSSMGKSDTPGAGRQPEPTN